MRIGELGNAVKKRYLTDVAKLASRLPDPDLRVVDCSFYLLQPNAGFREYLEGHIPGAVYAHFDNDLAAPITAATGRHPLPDISLFAQKLEDWGIGSDTEVVVYDQQSGGLATRLWWMLQWLGHTRVTVLDGGFAAWTAAELPQEQGETSHDRSVFEARPQEDMVVSTQDVLSGVRQGNLPVLVDARERERFLGEKEPIDTCAGHIPGAVNFPLAESLAASGHWLPQEQLRERWEPILSPVGEAGWIAMCGSGGTACHLALSAQYAGFAAPKIYIGSWSEWIRDPDRPRDPA